MEIAGKRYKYKPEGNPWKGKIKYAIPALVLAALGGGFYYASSRPLVFLPAGPSKLNCPPSNGTIGAIHYDSSTIIRLDTETSNLYVNPIDGNIEYATKAYPNSPTSTLYDIPTNSPIEGYSNFRQYLDALNSISPNFNLEKAIYTYVSEAQIGKVYYLVTDDVLKETMSSWMPCPKNKTGDITNPHYISYTVNAVEPVTNWEVQYDPSLATENSPVN